MLHGKAFSCSWGTRRFKRSHKITGVISDYVKGDSVRLIPACGAGSSCAPRSGQQPSSAPASQILPLSCPFRAGALPRASPGLPRPWLWAAPGHWGGQRRIFSPVLPIPPARWVLKWLRGDGSALGINRFISHPQSCVLLPLPSPPIAFCGGAGEGLQGYYTSWGVWSRAGTYNVGKLCFHCWDLRSMLDGCGMKLITRGFVSLCLEKGLQLDFIVHMFFLLLRCIPD